MFLTFSWGFGVAFSFELIFWQLQIYLSWAQVSHKAVEVSGLSEGCKDRVGRLIIDEVWHSKLVFPILPLSIRQQVWSLHNILTVV